MGDGAGTEKNPWMRPSPDSKPITKRDKAMSKKHKDHRKQLKKMDNGPAKKALSRKYNLEHAKEHLGAAGVPTGYLDGLIKRTGKTMGDLKKR